MHRYSFAILSLLFSLFIALFTIGPVVAASRTCSGVTKNSNGSVSFSWLSIKNGHFVDQSGCTVLLVGLNEGDFFTGDANAGTSYISDKYSFLKTSINQNVDRINFQARWWDEDILVPDANMHFRAWLAQYVSMAEQAGNYVELDVGPQYFEPPCGKGVSFCPAQDQGSKDYNADPACANHSRTCPEAVELSGGDESVVTQAITDVGSHYANDPAVIMDIWNEPLDSNPLNLSANEFFTDMNARINTFRSVAPKSPVVVYSYQIMRYMATGMVQPYQQSNLAIDMHDYSSNLQPSDLLAQIQYFQSRGWAVILNEFGGSTASETALKSIQSLASSVNMSAAYFNAGNLFDALNKTPPPYALNGNGLLVQTYYAQILPVVFMQPGGGTPSSGTGGSSASGSSGSGNGSVQGESNKIVQPGPVSGNAQPSLSTSTQHAAAVLGLSINAGLFGRLLSNPRGMVTVAVIGVLLVIAILSVFLLIDVPAFVTRLLRNLYWGLRTTGSRLFLWARHFRR